MKFYITTAIDYVNSRPHLGTAYEKILADVIARYHRLNGSETHFVMGNDEHSLNVQRRAVELGLDPIDYCDQMEREFRDVWATLDVSFDDFIRTSEPRHHAAVRGLIERIRAAGDIYEGSYEGWYCVSCEAFKQEKDLVDELCPIHRVTPSWIQEKNHFFRLSRYRDRLLEHFEAHPEFLEPDIRRNEILRMLEGGLEDISITRAGQTWGIQVPFDTDSVVYVWFDALINYISAAGFPDDAEMFGRLWPADLHLVGKDITRFHAVIWPAMLMSAGLELPRKVFGHGFVQFKGERMSKSLGAVVDPLEAAERFGADSLRMFLVREIPFGQDGDFSWQRFEERYNADLANNLGNLVSRVAAMGVRYAEGQLRCPSGRPGRVAGVAADVVTRYRTAMNQLRITEAVGAAFELIDATNEFITQTEPWALSKIPEQASQLQTVLFEAAEAIRISAILLVPIMPHASIEILRRLGSTATLDTLRLDRHTAWAADGDLTVVKADPLWPRLEGDRSG